MNPIITIQNISSIKNIPTKKQFQTWIATCLPRRKNYEIVIRIVTTKEIQYLNKTYRKKNKPTNIISFDFLAPPNIKSTLLGDLIICADIVRTEAKTENKTLRAHWAHLTIHGVLHLLGHDHQTIAEAEAMEKLETKLLKQLGFPPPY